MPTRRRLYVHIGLQKTGTTYLQAVMLGNRDRLASQGLALVPPTKKEAYQLMLAVRERYQPGRDPDEVADALTSFESRLARSSAPRMLLSQESLSAARPAQVRRFLARHRYALPAYLELERMPPAIGAPALPTTVVLDHTGRVVHRHRGAADGSTPRVRAALRALARTADSAAAAEDRR